MISTDICGIHPIEHLQSLLHKIDVLRLPVASRRDVETILVRQVTRELDRLLPWQRGHGRRTALTAVAIGRLAGLASDRIHHLQLASLLHDIGLLTLSPQLLHRSFRWETDTHVAMQCHPRNGAELLKPFDFLCQASVIIAHHHERWDGTGYPYGIRGPFIPIEARILAIADTFDALEVPGTPFGNIRNRVAYRILRIAAGTQFDPELVELCGSYLTQESRRRNHALHSIGPNFVAKYLEDNPS